MKIALITDTHFSFKKANKLFHEYFLKFYDNIFFPEIKKRNITKVIHLGDAFDSRKGIDYWALDWAKKNIYDKLENFGIDVYSIVGNHDAYYKNTNEINAIDSLLNQYTNIVNISKPIELNIDNSNFLFLPWICSENQKQTFDLIEKTNAKIVFGHLELCGFLTYPGYINTQGMNKSIFKKFNKVFSGHYHTRSDDGKIYYLGNPYQMFWNDVNDKRGFHIFDTKSYEIEYIENPYTLFEKIIYDEDDIEKVDFSILNNKIVKIIVKKKENEKKFENFLDKVYKENPLELKIADTIELYDDCVDCSEINTEDTITILDKYVEESEFNFDKQKIKNILREIYKEALEIQ